MADNVQTAEEFAEEIRTWLAEHLTGEFEVVRGRGGPGDEHMFVDERKAWELEMGKGGWIGISLPTEHGGRGADLTKQVIFATEYAKAGGPGRVGHIGEGLVAPTLVHFGTPEQQKRFLPGILDGTEIWCQGYSEPDAGSDLANLGARAHLDGDEWVITGQKVWTSLAHFSDWCFVLARTNPDAPKHKGITFLLIDMEADGIECRPIVQITGDAEFNEVYFTDARTPADHIVGEVDQGWKVAMGLLAFERGTSTIGQQLNFTNELAAMIEAARANGTASEAVIRQRLAEVWSRLQIMKWSTERVLGGAEGAELPREAMIAKLFWSHLHRDMGELWMDVLGADAMLRPNEGEHGDAYPLLDAQKLFMFSRSDTIYAGTSQIQRNIIGERALGLPREPR